MKEITPQNHETPPFGTTDLATIEPVTFESFHRGSERAAISPPLASHVHIEIPAHRVMAEENTRPEPIGELPVEPGATATPPAEISTAGTPSAAAGGGDKPPDTPDNPGNRSGEYPDDAGRLPGIERFEGHIPGAAEKAVVADRQSETSLALLMRQASLIRTVHRRGVSTPAIDLQLRDPQQGTVYMTVETNGAMRVEFRHRTEDPEHYYYHKDRTGTVIREKRNPELEYKDVPELGMAPTRDIEAAMDEVNARLEPHLAEEEKLQVNRLPIGLAEQGFLADIGNEAEARRVSYRELQKLAINRMRSEAIAPVSDVDAKAAGDDFKYDIQNYLERRNFGAEPQRRITDKIEDEIFTYSSEVGVAAVDRHAEQTPYVALNCLRRQIPEGELRHRLRGLPVQGTGTELSQASYALKDGKLTVTYQEMLIDGRGRQHITMYPQTVNADAAEASRLLYHLAHPTAT